MGIFPGRQTKGSSRDTGSGRALITSQCPQSEIGALT